MKQIIEKLLEYPIIKLLVAQLFLFMSITFNGSSQIIIAIYTMIIIDTFTGVWIAIQSKEITSRGFFRSPKKCLVYFLMLIVSRVVDKTMPIKIASPIMDAFLVTTEAVSILENLAKLGYPVPTFLVTKLKAFYTKS